MQESIKRLFLILDQLRSYHESLWEVVLQEKKALVELKHSEIEQVTFLKQQWLDQIDRAESERMKALAEFSLAFRIPLKELTLSRMIQEWTPFSLKEAEALKEQYSFLSHLIQKIVQQNRENQALIENFLLHIQRMKKNLIQESELLSSTYTARGSRTHPTGHSSQRLWAEI